VCTPRVWFSDLSLVSCVFVLCILPLLLASILISYCLSAVLLMHVTWFIMSFSAGWRGAPIVEVQHSFEARESVYRDWIA